MRVVDESWDITRWRPEDLGGYTDRVYVPVADEGFHRVLTVTHAVCEDCGRMAVGVDRASALAALHSEARVPSWVTGRGGER